MSTTPGGITGLDRIAQVKLPVSDLAVSVAWYRRLLDLRLWVETAEDDVLRGAGLIDPQGRFNISLRERTVCASRPDLNGFDVVAFLPASRSVLDPDGTVLRFYHFTDPTDGFTGVQFRHGRHVGNYHTPRLA